MPAVTAMPSPPPTYPHPGFCTLVQLLCPSVEPKKSPDFALNVTTTCFLKPLILCKFCGSFHENSDKKSQKSLEMVSKKSWFCPKGLNFAFVASFRAKSQILYRNAWKGPQLRNWSSWGPNCWNGPHFPQKVSCSPFPKCVSLQYVHFLHEMCNVVNTHFLKTFGNNDLRSSKAEKHFTRKVFFPPNDKCLPWVLKPRFCFCKHCRFVKP